MNTRFGNRVARLEANSNPEEPRALLADRPLTGAEAESLMANWRQLVESGVCQVFRGVLSFKSVSLSEEEWTAKHAMVLQ